MQLIEQLSQELEKVFYDDRQKIIDLYHEINTDKNNKPSIFIEIIEVRNKLFSNSKKEKLHPKVQGKGDWDGYLYYERSDFTDKASSNTAKVINTIDADIISLIEVEDKNLLDEFNRALIKKKYKYSMLIDAFDPRGIDVALLSRFPLEDIRTHMFDKKNANDRYGIFSRDCLEIKIKRAENDFIYFFINHFKSQGYGPPEKNDAKRLSQVNRVVEILGERNLNLQRDKVVVLGDFNAPPKSASLAPLLQMQGLKDVLELEIPNETKRVTYYYKDWQQIDFILVSEPLQAKCVGAGVERKGIYDLAKYTQKYPDIKEAAWPEVQVDKGIASASDHGAVWAEFTY